MINRILLFLILIPNLSWASQIIYPTVYAPTGQVTNVTLNGNNSAISNVVNGGLDNTNANTTAGYRFYQTVSILPSPGSQGAVYFLTSDNSLNFDTGSVFNKSVSVNSPVNGDMVYYNSGWNRLPIGTSNQVIQSNGTIPGYATLTSASISGFVNGLLPYIKLSNTQAQNTAGGTATSGGWNAIPINTTNTDSGSNVVSLGTNTFVLVAGTYEIEATCPFNNTGAFQTRLENTTGSSLVLTGSSGVATTSGNVLMSVLKGRFTVTASQNLQFQYQVNSTEATNGLGLPANFGSEVYAQIALHRVN